MEPWVKDDDQNAGKTIPKENNMFPPQPMMFDETLANYMIFPFASVYMFTWGPT
jgi:hypothetical protein